MYSMKREFCDLWLIIFAGFIGEVSEGRGNCFQGGEPTTNVKRLILLSPCWMVCDNSYSYSLHPNLDSSPRSTLASLWQKPPCKFASSVQCVFSWQFAYHKPYSMVLMGFQACGSGLFQAGCFLVVSEDSRPKVLHTALHSLAKQNIFPYAIFVLSDGDQWIWIHLKEMLSLKLPWPSMFLLSFFQFFSSLCFSEFLCLSCFSLYLCLSVSLFVFCGFSAMWGM